MIPTIAAGCIFQSTLPRRERRSCSCLGYVRLVFQSTLPRRERRNLCVFLAKHQYFNPRSREGSDAAERRAAGYDTISIHAPAKGATIFPGNRHARHRDFNPRSREGSDRILRKPEDTLEYFNPRSREGSDVYSAKYIN